MKTMKKYLLLLTLLITTICSFAQTDTLKVSTINPVLLNPWLQSQTLSNITGQNVLNAIKTGQFNYKNTAPPPVIIPPVTIPPTTNGEFVWDASQGYKLNSFGDGQADGGPWKQLQDGDTTSYVQEGSGELLSTSNYWLPLLNNTTAGVTISDIKLYSYTGSSTIPWTISAWNNGVETLLASFKGGAYKAWINYPIKNVLATRLHIVFQIQNSTQSGALWPTEMKIYGTSTPKAIIYSALPTIAFNDELGVNSFVWSLLNSTSPNTILPNHLKTFNSTLSNVRLYLDWKTIEPTIQGLNTFAPSHSGGWNLDVLLSTLKQNGILTLLDLKTQAPWMQATWPVNIRNDENIPVIYNNLANIDLPSAYKEQAKTAYQIALRYGSTVGSIANTTIDKTIQWNGDIPNIALTGLNTLSYLECDNERDKWWKGTKAWQNGYQYAANLSAFYDGDLGKLGDGYGVKTADPNMKVVYAGTADVTQNGFLASIQWCKDNRGGKLDWDIFNVHNYAGKVNPEQGLIDIIPLIKVAQQYNLPIWLTETGYDQQAGSPNAVPSIGNKSVELVQADWILRTVLWAARNGIARTFIYQDYDATPGNATAYATSGIFNDANSSFRKAAGDYLAEAKIIMTGFNFVSTATINGITTDIYKNTAGNTCEVLFSPTMTGTSIITTIPKGTIYTPVAGTSVMASKASVGTLTVTETPAFLFL